MPKKYDKNPMGNYVYTKLEQEAYEWCIANRVYVSPKAASSDKGNSKWYLIVDINSVTRTSPIPYGPVDIWKKQAEMYRFLYEKYTKKEKTIAVKEAPKEKKKEKSNQNLLDL